MGQPLRGRAWLSLTAVFVRLERCAENTPTEMTKNWRMLEKKVSEPSLSSQKRWV